MNPSWSHPEFISLEGHFVRLEPFDSSRHGAALYETSHGSPAKEAVWNYLFYGPFASAQAMASWYDSNLAGRKDPLVWTTVQLSTGQAVGISTLLNISADHGRAEIGHVWFGPEVHRTAVNTETQYLLLKHLLDHHRYRRVEWKCDSLNLPSRTTALRMGFAYEGRFFQHMMVKGKNRDTDWFAMLDRDWPIRRSNFERWLYSGEKLSLSRLNGVV